MFIRKKSTIALLILLISAFVLMLPSCGESDDPEFTVPSEAILKFGEEQAGGDFCFYGVVKSEGTYYLRVLDEYIDEPSEEQYKYIALADELSASFQPNGVDGAWNPITYLRADELADGYSDDMITLGARFNCLVTDDYAYLLNEYNYCQGVNITNGGEN